MSVSLWDPISPRLSSSSLSLSVDVAAMDAGQVRKEEEVASPPTPENPLPEEKDNNAAEEMKVNSEADKMKQPPTSAPGSGGDAPAASSSSSSSSTSAMTTPNVDPDSFDTANYKGMSPEAIASALKSIAWEKL